MKENKANKKCPRCKMHYTKKKGFYFRKDGTKTQAYYCHRCDSKFPGETIEKAQKPEREEVP
jgi:transposase-like protein